MLIDMLPVLVSVQSHEKNKRVFFRFDLKLQHVGLDEVLHARGPGHQHHPVMMA